MPKKMYVGVDNFTQRTLPSAYTQLAYIETDGASHIDTGITPDQNTRIDMDFEILSTTVNPSVLFGVRTSSGGTPYFGVVYLGTYLRFDYGTAQKTLTPSSLTGRVNLSVNKNVFSFGSSSVTNTTNTFTCGNTMFLFSYSNGGTQNSPVKARLYSCQIYDNGTLVRDYIPAESSGGVIGLYDAVSGGFSRNGGSGAFTAGSTYKGVARQVKKLYAGVDDVARKVKKGYIGVGGVARPFLGEGKPEYFGALTGLTYAAQDHAAASVGSYALFAAGYNNSGTSTWRVVTSYDSNLTKGTPTALPTGLNGMAGVSFGDYALFGGGSSTAATSKVQTTVYAYNTALTQTTPTVLSVARWEHSATTVGDYALFGGGEAYDSTEKDAYLTSRMDIYNKSLTRTTGTHTGVRKYAAVSLDSYALFGGGVTYTTDYNATSNVYAYNESITSCSVSSLTTKRMILAAARAGDYALFAGGYNRTSSSASANYYDEVIAYDKSLTLTTAHVLSSARYHFAGVTLGGYAIFAGGRTASALQTANMYDSSLTRTIATGLSTARYGLSAATAEDYAIFAGGYTTGSSTYTASVEAYALL